MACLGRLRPETTAFLLCDIQARFAPLIHGWDAVLATADKMVKAGKLLDIPLIVTEQAPAALGSTVPALGISHARLVVPKSLFSMYIPPVRDLLVDTLKTDTIVLFGIESHVCVTQTALDLLRAKRYHVIVLADGVSSIHDGEIRIALARLAAAGCTVASSESILFELLGDATHPAFKAVSALVKSSKTATRIALDTLAPKM